jgi:hypothetical protein
MSLQDWTNFSQIAAATISAGAFIYTGQQINLSIRVNRAQFWLELRKMFHEHKDVHTKLRDGGEWAAENSGPSNPSDWASVEAYMGLFEHCERMISEDLLDVKTFKSIYEYRIHNIVQNSVIYETKLINEAKYWGDFLMLMRRCGIDRQ